MQKNIYHAVISNSCKPFGYSVINSARYAHTKGNTEQWKLITQEQKLILLI